MYAYNGWLSRKGQQFTFSTHRGMFLVYSLIKKKKKNTHSKSFFIKHYIFSSFSSHSPLVGLQIPSTMSDGRWTMDITCNRHLFPISNISRINFSPLSSLGPLPLLLIHLKVYPPTHHAHTYI